MTTPSARPRPGGYEHVQNLPKDTTGQLDRNVMCQVNTFLLKLIIYYYQYIIYTYLLILLLHYFFTYTKLFIIINHTYTFIVSIIVM